MSERNEPRSNTRIAVVVPAYNASRFIARTLDFVAAQTLPPDEVIVVDDGSTDDTAERVEQWASANTLNLTLIRKENGGASSARNAGVRAATAELIATLDADDEITPDHLAKLAKGFQMEPAIVLCFGDASAHNAERVLSESFISGSDIERLAVVERDGLHVIQESAYRGLVKGNRIPTSSTMFRRHPAIECGLYDESQKQCNDVDFLLRLSRLGTFAYFKQVINRHQRHETNLTHPRFRVANRRYRIRMLKKMLAIREQLALNDEEIQATRQAIDKAARSMVRNAADRGIGTYLPVCLELIRGGQLQPLAMPLQLVRSFRGGDAGQ